MPLMLGCVDGNRMKTCAFSSSFQRTYCLLWHKKRKWRYGARLVICPLLHLLRHAIVSYVRNTVTTYVTPKPWLLAAFDRVFSWEVLILTFAYYMASPFWSTAVFYC